MLKSRTEFLLKRNRFFYIGVKLAVIFIKAVPLVIRALVVLMVLSLIWLIHFISFSPVLILLYFMPQTRKCEKEENPIYTEFKTDRYSPFNRVHDVSKIFGCNTRSVRYRWDVFIQALESIKSREACRILNALDFGAGSLRDTYELARLGFQVAAIDKNETTLLSLQQSYDWNAVSIRPNIRGISLFDLERHKKFDVIIAFDVLEHLYELDEHVSELRKRLNEGGIMLVTVPNSCSLHEKDARRKYQKNIRKGLLDESGGAHVQFRTAEEWEFFFPTKGFTILNHDMGIGFLVNDCWFGFYAIPVRNYVEPVIIAIANITGLHYTPLSLEKLFYPAWLMEQVNLIDEALKPFLKNRWGWNLFVLGLGKNNNSGG